MKNFQFPNFNTQLASCVEETTETTQSSQRSLFQQRYYLLMTLFYVRRIGSPKILKLQHFLLSYPEKTLSQANPTKPTNDEKSGFYKNEEWKFKPPVKKVPISKKVNEKTFYWCSKPHFRVKPMWAVHKSEDYKHSTSPARNPKTEGTVDLQLLDQLRSLIVVVRQDFSQTGSQANRH